MAPGLNVIALVSGGKDSFFSLLHCRANGHRVVALANLYPPLPPQLQLSGGGTPPAASAAVSGNPRLASDVATQASSPDPNHQGQGGVQDGDDQYEQDLNSFMYQTVGHQVIPLYAEATELPLYRRAIIGGAGEHGKDYSYGPSGSGSGSGPEDTDETESMTSLLQVVMAAHPEADAVSAGAILSTYQRTRVESVATRLGLVPLAYLWKFPILPGPSGASAGDAQLLDDLAAAGLEARIIKVASGGLDDSFLWTNVASAAGKQRLINAMRRFGAQETGAVIGEGGEFETLVLNGPSAVFRKRIALAEEDRRVVREGGGNAWLKLRNARLETRDDPRDSEDVVRIPNMLDADFWRVLDVLTDLETPSPFEQNAELETAGAPNLGRLQKSKARLEQWCFFGDSSAPIKTETTSIVKQIRQRLGQTSLTPSAIISTTILLRRMADFPAINSIYGVLFDGAPNPPSRVTVSCRDQLPPGINIAVYLSVHVGLRPGARQGLHVQSRSYWAPANIGPYSQAITIPVDSFSDRTVSEFVSGGVSLKLVAIAGQIPLIPATMALPDHGGVQLQVVLSLQHLWRIGLEMGVQWWGSAVAYFPVCQEDMAWRARLAGRAWDAAHRLLGSETDENETGDGGPDLWDRKFDARYMTFGSEEKLARLPEWDVLAGKRTVPVVFAAEVDELPRAAGVEWHSHVGFAGLMDGSVAVKRQVMNREVGGTVDMYQTVVTSGGGSVVQTVLMEGLPVSSEGMGHSHGKGRFDEVDHIARTAVSQLGKSDVGQVFPTARYVAKCGSGWDGPVVPCVSLWDARGRQLASVSVYQTFFEPLSEG